VPFAAQIDGSVILNPAQQTQTILCGGEVAFFIAFEGEDLERLAQGAVLASWNWVEQYQSGRHVNDSRRSFIDESRPILIERQVTTEEASNPSKDDAADTSKDILFNKSTHIQHPVELGSEHSRRSLAKQVSAYGCHILIISCSGGKVNWSQIRMVFKSLRDAERRWEYKPVIILANELPPPGLACEYPDVVYLHGNALNSVDIQAGQPDSASHVILLADHMPEDRGLLFKDQQTLLIAGALDSHLASIQCQKEVHLIMDLFTADSSNLLSDNVHGDDTIRGRVRNLHAEVSNDSSNRTWKKHMGLWKESTRLNTRFACGQLFTLNFIGRMLGRDYYVPSSMEIIMNLVTCANQTSFPWLVPVPEEFCNGPYGKLLEAWTQDQDPATPLGVHRALCPKSESAMARALGYVISNPTSELLLQPSDRIFAFGSQEFGQRMLARELCLGEDNLPPWMKELHFHEGTSFYPTNDVAESQMPTAAAASPGHRPHQQFRDPGHEARLRTVESSLGNLKEAIVEVTKLQCSLQMQLAQLISNQQKAFMPVSQDRQGDSAMPDGSSRSPADGYPTVFNI
jgi:hypothetical protein